MTAQLRLVAQAGHGQADEAALQRLGDGLANRGLAGARGTGETEDRSLAHLHEQFLLQHLPDRGAQFVQVYRLAQVVGRPSLEGIHRRTDRGEPGDHDHRHLGRGPVDLLEQFQAVHALHLQIRDHQVDLLPGHHLHRFGAVAGVVAGISLLDEHMLHVGAGDLLVVDDEDGLPRLAAQRLGGEKLVNPLFHPGQAVVPGLEHGLGPGQVELALARPGPRQGQDHLDVVQAEGIFAQGRIGLFQLGELGGQNVLHVLRQLCLPGPPAQRVQH